MTDLDPNSDDQNQIAHANDWLEKHGQLSFQSLKYLAQAGTPEAIESLHQFADDYSFTYDQTTSLMDLAEKIYSPMENDPNKGVE